jgi:hypothetical protein
VFFVPPRTSSSSFCLCESFALHRAAVRTTLSFLHRAAVRIYILPRLICLSAAAHPASSPRCLSPPRLLLFPPPPPTPVHLFSRLAPSSPPLVLRPRPPPLPAFCLRPPYLRRRHSSPRPSSSPSSLAVSPFSLTASSSLAASRLRSFPSSSRFLSFPPSLLLPHLASSPRPPRPHSRSRPASRLALASPFPILPRVVPSVPTPSYNHYLLTFSPRDEP